MRRSPSSRLLLFVLIMASMGLAQSAPAKADTSTTQKAATAAAWPKLKYEKYKLKNGLEVILSEDHRLPLVAVNLWYHVGPANERPGRTGFAHLFEHMMFQGSQNVGEKAHFRYLEAAGASMINGTTDFDRTNYFETIPSNQLELALWLESDRMGFLLPTLDAPKLANQRDVVRNERRQSTENRPYGLAEEAVFHELFPKGHPYYASVIGSHADIEAAKIDDVREFFKQYYAPNNASVAIVGDFNPATIKAQVEKYFGPIPSGPPVPKIDVKTPAITSERRATVTDKVELPKVYVAWITDPIFKPGDAEADLLAQILGGGKSSRLYKKLVYEKQIAQDVQAYQYSLMLGSFFGIEATAKPGVKPEDLEAAINEEVAAIRDKGVTAEELSRARNTIQSNIIRRLQSLGGFGGVADRLNQYNHFLGNPGYLPEDLARYQNATEAGVQKVAKNELGNNQRVVVYCVSGEKKIEDVPKTTGDETASKIPSVNIPNQEWRKKAPEAGPLSKATLPVPKQFKLNNRLTVFLTEQHNLPIVSARLVTLTGSDANPADKPGLASFTADMLDEGTSNRAALKIADDLAQIGAELSTDSSSDASGVFVSSLKRNTPAALDIMSDVTLHPAFDQKEIDRIRKQRLTTLIQINDEPNSVAQRVFNRVVYGEKHPYGFMEIGTEASNNAIQRDDIANFWKSGYVPGNAALVVAGDITQPELTKLAEQYFGKWQGSREAAKSPEFNGSVARNIFIVDKPGAAQTQLRVGSVGVPMSSPDYVGLRVMNAALGGTFSSRVNMNLREKHGYTYGAFSTFNFRRGPGPFFIGTGVRGDTTAESVKEIFNEVDGMRNGPITPAELSLAKDAIARSLPGLFETTEQTASAIARLYIYSLPLDFYRTLPGRIDQVDAPQVQKLAEKYLTPDKLVVVAVGDRAKIEPGLQKLGLGAVEVRTVEGDAPAQK